MRVRSPLLFGMAFALLLLAPQRAKSVSGAIRLAPLGVHATGQFNVSAAEIPAYDPATRRLFVVNAQSATVDVLDIQDPTTPALLMSIGAGPGVVNSVAVHNGLVAVAVENVIKTNPGFVKFFNTDGVSLGSVTVGALPDMLTFTPNGRFLLVANEAEPDAVACPTIDPDGSVSVISTQGGVPVQDDVRTADFTGFNGVTLPSSVRIFGPASEASRHFEPEYITVSQDSKKAWVTLQENNAIAVVDVVNAQVEGLFGLGFKNHNVAANGLDASDQDSAINIRTWPVLGIYQPDAIDSYRVGGQTYLVTANEGDAREWGGGTDACNELVRVGAGSVVLDPAVFSNAAVDFKPNSKLGRLRITKLNGQFEADGDSQFERLYALGARSFSIWTPDGQRVFDSGDDFEQITAAALPTVFNASHTGNAPDDRSDDKGPEPEGVVLGKAYGRTYAFIGLERIGGVMVYDVTDPRSASFVQYVNTRNFSQTPGVNSGGDLGPEGMVFIKADESPNGKPLLVVAYEISGTTRIFEVVKD